MVNPFVLKTNISSSRRYTNKRRQTEMEIHCVVDISLLYTPMKTVYIFLIYKNSIEISQWFGFDSS